MNVIGNAPLTYYRTAQFATAKNATLLCTNQIPRMRAATQIPITHQPFDKNRVIPIKKAVQKIERLEV
ncbi:MAG: hypothetical protein ACI89J_001241 [Hyphomicrobiaceae bacterium]|jgi:hypothetical protein